MTRPVAPSSQGSRRNNLRCVSTVCDTISRTLQVELGVSLSDAIHPYHSSRSESEWNRIEVREAEEHEEVRACCTAQTAACCADSARLDYRSQ